MLYFKREYLLREQSMVTFLLMICILIALVATSIIGIKIQKKQRFLKRQKNIFYFSNSFLGRKAFFNFCVTFFYCQRIMS